MDIEDAAACARSVTRDTFNLRLGRLKLQLLSSNTRDDQTKSGLALEHIQTPIGSMYCGVSAAEEGVGILKVLHRSPVELRWAR